MAISRTRSAQHKVHIPTSASENQYLMAKFPLTNKFIEKHSDLIDEKSTEPYAKFYQVLADKLFKINDELGIESSLFIANDKFARVRFSPEKLTTQTKQQVLSLYNPEYHTSHSTFFKGNLKARQIKLLFLANGKEIRFNAAKFNQKVGGAISRFMSETGLSKEYLRISDHQHLSYDLFAKNKGVEGTQAHKFRSMNSRYLAQETNLPENIDALTYAIIDFPLNRRVRALVTSEDNEPSCHNELYNLIADAFISSAKKQNLYSGAVIANGLVPIVRKCEDENVITNGELLMLGFNPTHTNCGYTCKWESDKLVNTVQLIFVACDKDKTPNGYGKFVNQIEKALRDFAQRLDFINDKEEMLVRFHQHIAFYVE